MVTSFSETFLYPWMPGLDGSSLSVDDDWAAPAYPHNYPDTESIRYADDYELYPILRHRVIVPGWIDLWGSRWVKEGKEKLALPRRSLGGDALMHHQIGSHRPGPFFNMMQIASGPLKPDAKDNAKRIIPFRNPSRHQSPSCGQHRGTHF